MTNHDPQDTANVIRSELDAARAAFHAVLDSMTKDDAGKKSLNSGWTNSEIMTHIVFGFIILNVLLPMARGWGRLPKGSSKWFAWLLNAGTWPFNWINGLGARFQGKIFTYDRIGGIFDRSITSLLGKVDNIHDDEWKHGMYYPNRWDSNFDEFMTLEKLFHYPVIHCNFHLGQISR